MAEARIRALYDACEQRNYKAAIKLANAGIQKYPDRHVFKSLKAHALERSGKLDEALQLVESVLAAAPPDDHVLNMLLLVLRPANRTAELLPAYEAALAKQPGNEELAQGLFACHVRACAYREQQQVALRLNKAHACELYQWWAVTAIVLQAHAAAVAAQLAPTGSGGGGSAGEAGAATAAQAGGLSADKCLQLAEAMAARLLAKPAGAKGVGEPPAWESVMMYLGLLAAQGKHDAALAALRGPLAARIPLPAERREAEAALLLGKGDLPAAAALYKAALREQPDDWAALLLLLDCLLPGSAAGSRPACAATGVAQMATGVEASTLPGFLASAGGVEGLLAAMAAPGAAAGPSLQERAQKAGNFIASLQALAAQAAEASSSSSSSPNGSGQAVIAASDSSTNGSSDGHAAGGGSGVLVRGPLLAAVELASRQLLLGLASQQALVESLLQYHERCGHIVSCAMDCFCYLEHLDSSARDVLSSQLAARAEQAAADFQQLQQQQGEQQGEQQQEEQGQQQQEQQGEQQQDSAHKAVRRQLLRLLRRQMSARQMCADMGCPVLSGADAAGAHARQLLALYARALPLYQGLDERERGPADELLWQAAAALVQAASLQQQQAQQQQQPPGTHGGAAVASGCMSSLLHALLVLEAAARGRPYCAPVRLGLTGLHGLLGNARGAAAHFAVLDVKHVQHDTLSSHHLLPLLLGLRAAPSARELLGATCALFEDHLRDAGDTLMQAYRAGTHTKVLEFVCFKERLERSHTFVLARAERALLSIAAAAAAAGVGAAPEAAAAAAAAAVQLLPLALLDSCDWRGMRFNDDLTTRLPWLPPIAGPRHLVVLLWWEQLLQQAAEPQQQQQQQQGSSTPACWWRRVAAAEADHTCAAQLRAAMRAAAQQRWLLPHLLQAALLAGGGAASSGSKGGAPDGSQQAAAALPQLLASLSDALGTGSRERLEQALTGTFAADCASAGVTPLSRQLQLLDAAVFSLAESVQDLLAAAHAEAHAGGGAAGDAAGVVVQRADRVAAALTAHLQPWLAQELQPGRAFLGALLPGHVLSAAALAAGEACSWATLCLEAWSKAVKHARKRKHKKPAAAAAPPAAASGVLGEPVGQQAVAALERAAAAASGLLAALEDGARSLLAVPADQAADALLAAFADAAVAGLVGWAPSLSVQLVLRDLLREQRALLARVAEDAAALGQRVAALSW